MSKQMNYNVGHSVHSIQAMLALNERKLWRAARIDDIESDTVTVSLRDGAPPRTDTCKNGTATIILCDREPQKLACADADRLRKLSRCGPIIADSEGNRVAVLAAHGVLIIPCGNGIQEFLAHTDILTNPPFMKKGASLVSPTTNEGWYLFSVRHIQ